MKRKIEVYHEPCVDGSGHPVRQTIRTFKNEPEARTFYNDDKNVRRYGALFMSRKAADGTIANWDDRTEAWV